MKKIVIACGAGLATSSMVREKVEEELKEHGISCEIMQCTLHDVESYDGQVDLIITTMKVKKKFTTPLVHGSAYLTGINEEAVTQQIMDILA